MKKEIEITASLVAYTPNSNKIGGVNGGGQGGGGGYTSGDWDFSYQK